MITSEPRIHHASGLLLVEQRLKAGHEATKHVHDYEHMSILGHGFAVLHVEGSEPLQMRAPQVAVVPAGHQHYVYAISDITWYCIHATQGPLDESVTAFLDKESA